MCARVSVCVCVCVHHHPKYLLTLFCKNDSNFGNELYNNDNSVISIWLDNLQIQSLSQVVHSKTKVKSEIYINIYL